MWWVIASKKCSSGKFGRSWRDVLRVNCEAAWIAHTSCTHHIAGCRDRSRIVGRKRYPGRCLYRLYQDPKGCQAPTGSWSRSDWCSKTKAVPDRQRQGIFSRVPKKLSKQVSHSCAIITPSPNPWHRAPHSQHIELADEIAEKDCAVAGHQKRAYFVSCSDAKSRSSICANRSAGRIPSFAVLVPFHAATVTSRWSST